MTSDTSVRIWTPLNTIVALRLAPHATVDDALSTLLATSDIASNVLGDFEDAYEWNLYLNSGLNHVPHHQRLSSADPLPSTLKISSVIAASNDSGSPSRTPLRIASAHPLLTIALSLWNLPEIDEGKALEWGVTASSTVGDILNGIVELYDIPLEVSDCVIHAVEKSRQHEILRPISLATKVVDLESRHLRLSVPDEWYQGESQSPAFSEPISSQTGSVRKSAFHPSLANDSARDARKSTLSSLFDPPSSSPAVASEPPSQGSRRRNMVTASSAAGVSQRRDSVPRPADKLSPQDAAEFELMMVCNFFFR
ncbi:hypothetical protein DL93DRAFT_1298220 [Clavulina sp. PMI_390]|nr:hypothetical protein DL93DRAFT_1298220 [Clavulina sp. PMI_390]